MSLTHFQSHPEKVPLSLLLLSRVFTMGSGPSLVDILARRLTISDRRKLGACYLRQRSRVSKATKRASPNSGILTTATANTTACEGTPSSANKQSIQSTEPGLRFTAYPSVSCDLPSFLPVLGQEIALLRAFVAKELNAILFNVENP